MDVVGWLEQIAKLDELIDGKKADMDRVRGLAYNTVGNMDGMPHAPGIADKVGSLSVKLAALDEEIRQYERQRQAKVDMLAKLPKDEYGVLHRQYVRYMKQEQIALDMGYCKVQIWRIGKRAKRMLAEMLEKERG